MPDVPAPPSERDTRNVVDSALRDIVPIASSQGVEIDEATISSLVEYAVMLLEAARDRSLTSISDPSRLAVTLFLDSLLFIRSISPGASRLVDVGTGAGFPSVPIAVAMPSLSVTAVDARLMKCRFVQSACKRLAVTNLETLHGRAEDLAVTIRRTGAESSGQRFKRTIRHWDVAVAKALAPLRKSLELLLPLVRPGGRVIVATMAEDMNYDVDWSSRNWPDLEIETWVYRLPGYRRDFAQVIVDKP